MTKMLFLAVMTLALAAAQNPNTSAAQSSANQPQTQIASRFTVAPSSGEDAIARRARGYIEQMVAALGGDTYIHAQGFFYRGRSGGFSNRELNSLMNVEVWDKFTPQGEKQRVEHPKEPGWVTIFSGDNAWDITYHGTRQLEAKYVDSWKRRQAHSLGRVVRVWLRDPKTIYFDDGEQFFEANPAHAVTIINGQNESVTVLIDPKTFLPAKMEWKSRDTTYHDQFSEAMVYDKYREVDGVQTPFILGYYRNDELAGQTFVTEATYADFPDAIFTPEYKSAAPRPK